MIEIKGLSKVYREKTAVDNVDLRVREDEVFGLLGPNGAGKTTLLMMLSTLLDPTHGRANIEGYDILREPGKVKRLIGILFQDPSLDERLTGYENLEIQTVLYDVPKDERESRITEMFEFIGLTKWMGVPVQRYSGGMKRRLELARCLLHEPKVLLLDEPTLGLDPKAREAVWKHIKRLEGMTVVLATNYIEEAEYLCDKIGIIDSGKVVASGAPEDLKASLDRDFGKVTVKDAKTRDTVLDRLSHIESIDNVSPEGLNISYSLASGRRKEVAEALADLDVESMEIHKPTLNDVFFKYTGRSIEIGMDRPLKRKRLGKRRMR